MMSAETRQQDAKYGIKNGSWENNGAAKARLLAMFGEGGDCGRTPKKTQDTHKKDDGTSTTGEQGVDNV